MPFTRVFLPVRLSLVEPIIFSASEFLNLFAKLLADLRLLPVLKLHQVNVGKLCVKLSLRAQLRIVCSNFISVLELRAKAILVIYQVLLVVCVVLSNISIKIVEVCASLRGFDVALVLKVFTSLEPGLLVSYEALMRSFCVLFVLCLSFEVKFVYFTDVI